MALNIADGPAYGFIDGLPFTCESISVSVSGAALEKKTFAGTFFSPTTPSTKITIKGPYFGNATPLQVARLAQKLTNVPSLLTVTSKVSGATDTAWVVFDGRDKEFNAGSGADETWNLLATEPIEV